jgi:hypothetical protein
MERFFQQKPIAEPGKRYSYLDISFKNLIKTIAHENAHRFQMEVNADDDKLDENGKFREPLSDCFESGEGERDEHYNLIKPVYPQLVQEHKGYELGIEQTFSKSELEEYEKR